MEHVEALGRVAQALTEAPTLESVARVIVEQARSVLHASRVALWLLDRQHATLHLLASSGVSDEVRTAVRDLPLNGPYLACQAARSRAPVEVPDIDLLPPDAALIKQNAVREGQRSLYSQPLIARHYVVGVITFSFVTSRSFTAADRAAIALFADLCVVALENTRLREAAEKTAAELRDANRLLTQRAQCERELAQEAEGARRQATDILESISDAFSALDEEWRFTYVNRRAEVLWGIARERLLGKRVWDEFPTLLGSQAEVELRRAARERRVVEFQVLSPVMHRWIEATVYPNPTGLSLFARDVTERRQGEEERERLLAEVTRERNHATILARQAEKAISELMRQEGERANLLRQLAGERNWLRTVIDRSPVGIVLAEGAHGERIIANREVERLFGRSLPPEGGIEQYVGQILDAAGVPRPRTDLAVVLALEGTAVAHEEEILRRPDGTEARVLVSTVPMREGNHIIGAVVAYEDVTRIRELEREREEWTSIIAHDLRQPVTIILGNVGLLERQLRQRASPRESQTIEHVMTAARNLNTMIGDLLDLSRIEARRLVLEREVVDLAALVRGVVERAAAVTQGHGVTVEVDGEIPKVSADPTRVEQILGNLLSNAAKYGYRNSEILVRVTCQDGFDEVAVTNQGQGIVPEELPRLFTRFYRTRGAKERRVGGVGLGLSIARGLVEAHGGRIRVESVPGQTTTFAFTLPIARAAD